MRSFLRKWAGLALLAAALALLPGLVRAGPIVVELFTSQGCETCPPADEFLGELAQREDVLPLSIHVNYWDYLGWPDPYATEEGTSRQRAYAHRLGERFVYTPQMVVQGITHEAGHRREKIHQLLEDARAAAREEIDIVFGRTETGEMTATVSASAFDGEAKVLLALFDYAKTTRIPSGENGGQTLTYYNVVRSLEEVGTYNGAAVTIVLPRRDDADERDACAVLVQVADQGPIIAAGTFPFNVRPSD